MKTTGIGPNLNLKRITGLRADNINKATKLKVKPEDKLATVARSMKSEANVTRDGYKK